jgi:hypothetical protein
MTSARTDLDTHPCAHNHLRMDQDRRPRVRRPLLVLVLAAALALSVPSAASAAASGAASQQPIKTVTVHSNGHKYVLKVWAKASSKHCLAHAYGHKIRHFLNTHHCTGVVRYLVTTKVNGHGVGFAQSAASFAAKSESRAFQVTGEFRKLISENGTGNFYSLFHDGDHVPSGPQSVPDPDAFKALSQDVVVTSVDAWYLHRHTPENAHPLIQMIKNIYLQWFV